MSPVITPATGWIDHGGVIHRVVGLGPSESVSTACHLSLISPTHAVQTLEGWQYMRSPVVAARPDGVPCAACLASGGRR